MPNITLNRKQLDTLNDFLVKHNLDKWFLAKDDGAYIGATAGSHEDDTFERCIFYFKGCDPVKDGDACWDNTCAKFGGDDFGEHFPAADLHKVAEDATVDSMIMEVGKKSIKIKTRHQNAPAPVAPVAAPKAAPAKKMGVGAFAMRHIAEGKTNAQILLLIGVAFPDANTTSKSLNWYRNKMKKDAK